MPEPWTLLTGVARSLLGPRARSGLERDPVWEVLAELAGRESDAELGYGLPRTAVRTIPARWLAEATVSGSSGRTLLYRARGSGVRLHLADGRPISDHRFERVAPVDAARQALSQWAADAWEVRRAPRTWRAAAAGNLARPSTPEFRRLLALTVPWVEAFVSARVSVVGVRRAGAVMHLLERRGTIHATAAHLDVILPLDEASIAVRMSGFDRDPGWQPRLGRVIAYHFDQEA